MSGHEQNPAVGCNPLTFYRHATISDLRVVIRKPSPDTEVGKMATVFPRKMANGSD